MIVLIFSSLHNSLHDLLMVCFVCLQFVPKYGSLQKLIFSLLVSSRYSSISLPIILSGYLFRFKTSLRSVIFLLNRVNVLKTNSL